MGSTSQFVRTNIYKVHMFSLHVLRPPHKSDKTSDPIYIFLCDVCGESRLRRNSQDQVCAEWSAGFVCLYRRCIQRPDAEQSYGPSMECAVGNKKKSVIYAWWCSSSGRYLPWWVGEDQFNGLYVPLTSILWILICGGYVKQWVYVSDITISETHNQCIGRLRNRVLSFTSLWKQKKISQLIRGWLCMKQVEGILLICYEFRN